MPLMRTAWKWIAGAAGVAAIGGAIYAAPYALGFWHKAHNPALSALYERVALQFKTEQFQGGGRQSGL